MQIVESFLSLQGEGKFAGSLALFIRFAGCNFNCSGFGVQKTLENGTIIKGCDSLRAVFTKEFEKQYENLDAKSLFKKVLELKGSLNPLIIITGGEPLLHHKNPEFLSFLNFLLQENLKVHFESNASIEIDFEKYPLYKQCSFALGVKLSNSQMSKEKRLNFKALGAIVKYSKESFYKFVLDGKMIDDGSAKKEISEILKQVDNEVFCMPMGENEMKLKLNALKVAEFCIKNGYNYSDRIHIRLWGDKEGV